MDAIKVLVSICSARDIPKTALASIFGMWMSANNNLQLAFSFETDAQIDRARSIVASDFMRGGGDVLLFIDDDIICNPADVGKIVREAKAKKAIIAGGYRVKSTQENRLAIAYLDQQPITIGPNGPGLVEVKYAATGFMAIPRAVLQQVAAQLPLVDAGAGKQQDGRPVCQFWPFFQPFYPEGEYLSEDYSFCHRAREIGIKVLVDTQIVLGHVGHVTFWPQGID